MTAAPASGAPRARPGRPRLPLLLLSALIGAALATSITLWASTREAPSDARTVSAGRFTVIAEPYDGGRDASIAATLLPGRQLRAPGDGLVTSADCPKDGVLRSGQSVFEVGGRAVLSLHTPHPLYRDLSQGSTGRDVRELQATLARLGHAVEQTGTYDPPTQAAVAALAAPTEPGPATLRASSVLWLPGDQVTISTCALTVGQLVHQGDAVASTSEQLDAVRLRADLPPLLGGERWEFVTEAARLALGDDLVPVDRAGVLDAALAAREPGAPSAQINGRVVLTNPQAALVMPAPYVHVGADGRACVFLLGATTGTPVEVLDSAVGRTVVRSGGELVEGADVELVGSRTC